jgi:hypothetical protein
MELYYRILYSSVKTLKFQNLVWRRKRRREGGGRADKAEEKGQITQIRNFMDCSVRCDIICFI